MLPPKNKFSRIDFENLKQKNNSIKTKRINTDIGFFVFPEDAISPSKKTVVVSKKISKSAVERNNLKRLFYNLMLELSLTKSFIFFPNKKFTKGELQEIIKNICLQQ